MPENRCLMWGAGEVESFNFFQSSLSPSEEAQEDLFRILSGQDTAIVEHVRSLFPGKVAREFIWKLNSTNR